MPAPLIWLGAVALGAYTANKSNTQYLKHKRIVDAMPGESTFISKPRNGSVVTCGIYGVLDHTGIWVDGNIYELAGSGLIRCVSPERFVDQRSGSTIYVACDLNNRALLNADVAIRVRSLLYTTVDYHLMNQNCHRFVAESLANSKASVTSFSDLNAFLSDLYNTPIRWNKAKVNFR